MLPNGNFVVTDPKFGGAAGTPAPGAVYLHHGGTLEVISVLKGSAAGDSAGSGGVRVLTNGNFVVLSPGWNGKRGAVTWGSATAGVSGQISSSNSLTGAKENDAVGSGKILVLANGNYVAGSAAWNGGRGAATWLNGASGSFGEVSEENSLVGSRTGDQVGSEFRLLTNGNYLVRSGYWNERRGAVTWGSGTEGVRGVVSPANSLTGGSPNDFEPNDEYGSSVVELGNGNYVVRSAKWNARRGAVTWGSGSAGVAGEISAANSLVGSAAGDQVGSTGYGITVLNGGNYVVNSTLWNQKRGAATWGDGTVGVAGEISAANSLTGSAAGDATGMTTALANGNYVVTSIGWNGGRGAFTWVNGASGMAGTVSAANSLVGAKANDGVGYLIEALGNGGFVAISPNWNEGRGAATWASGNESLTGSVSSANSLVGSSVNDWIGNEVIELTNGNYVLSSSNWNGARGAVTWGSAVSGVKGTVSSSNSLVGGAPGDQVGSSGVTPLSNGNYVVRSSMWSGARGAATWGNGTSGTRGTVSSSNSLVGGKVNDAVGKGDMTLLSNGNYLVSSIDWNNYLGALTWGSGITGVQGTVSSANSLVGATGQDFQDGGVTALSNGSYVVRRPGWNQFRGAVIWSHGDAGLTGTVDSLSANALTGSSAGDAVGSGQSGDDGVVELANGNFVVQNPHWNGGRGAWTWGSGVAGVKGPVSAENSLVGISPVIGGAGGGHQALPDGNYVINVGWSNGAIDSPEALILGDGTLGTRGLASSVNTLLGNVSRGSYPSSWTYDTFRSRVLFGYWAGNLVGIQDLSPLPAESPKIEIVGNGLVIANGDNAPSKADHTDFGEMGYGEKVVRRFEIRNAGNAVLHLMGNPAVGLTGDESGDFAISAQPVPVIPAGGSSFIDISFTPGNIVPKKAAVSILNDDGANASLNFAIQGAYQSLIGQWRETYFGSAVAEVGNLEDFDHDGVGNLLEFAFGTLPNDNQSGPAPLSYSGGLSGGGTVVSAGMPTVLFEKTAAGYDRHAVFARRKNFEAVFLTYTVQFSSDLLTWFDSFSTQPLVLADDGKVQIVSIPYLPATPENQTWFFRVKVNSNQ